MRLHLLEPVIKRYEWGSPLAIPAMFGWSADGRAVAELWFGDHARSPSTAFDAHGFRPLDELLAADAALGGSLGYMLKVLGVAAPLSLQCHPDARHAERGFAAETARGVAVDAPERSFPDRRAKPEIIYALGRFEALVGVRSAADIRALAARIGLAGLDARLPLDDGDVARFVAEVLALAPTERSELLAAARVLAGSDPVSTWLARLATRYPDDPAALAPLFLHHVELGEGDAIFLAPRQLHAYLGGTALELTGASDNVVRGGLTGKHVDVTELLAVADLAPAPVARLAAEGEGGLRRFRGPSGGQVLALARVEQPTRWPAVDSAAIALGLRGEIHIAAGDEQVELCAGDACLISPGQACELTGTGVVAIATCDAGRAT